MYKKALDGKILKGEKKLINGTEVPIYLVADSAYPISDFIMKPFDFSSNMSQDIKIYNYRISHARIVVKKTFGRLKARWHRLQKQNMFIENVSTIVASCCLLHNICQLHGDSFNSEWLNDLNNSKEPQESNNLEKPHNSSFNDNSSPNHGKTIRNTLITLTKVINAWL